MSSVMIFWITLIILGIIVELITVDLIAIFFSVGSIIALVMNNYNLPFYMQCIVLTIVVVIGVTLTRPVARKLQGKKIDRTNSDRIIGQQGIVIKEINGIDFGQVKVNQEIWSAISVNNTPIKEGSNVEVVDITGVKVKVKEI